MQNPCNSVNRRILLDVCISIWRYVLQAVDDCVVRYTNWADYEGAVIGYQGEVCRQMKDSSKNVIHQ